MGGGVECPELSRRGGVSVRGDHGSEGAAPWPRDPAGRVAWCPLREVTPQPWVMGHRGMPLASFPRGPSIPAPLSATCGREEIGLARFGTPTGFGTRSSACITWPGTRARFPEPVSRAYPREAGIYPVARGSRAGTDVGRGAAVVTGAGRPLLGLGWVRARCCLDWERGDVAPQEGT